MTRHATTTSWVVLIASEAFSAGVGFLVLIRMARVLEPHTFSSVEYATAVAALMLVWVRGGVETIIHREAARKPRLIIPLSETLLVAKLALAMIGFMLMIAYGLAVKGTNPLVLISAGWILLPAALCLDVAPKSRGELHWIASFQFLRAIGLAVVAFLVVSGPKDAILAASCLGIAELIAALGFGWLHVHRFGVPRLRTRSRAIHTFVARGAVTSLGRFARVFLYAADLLILGVIVGSTELGSFSAARRIVFALVGVGLIVPSILGPWIAKAWSVSRRDSRKSLASFTANILGPTLAASIGLMLTSQGWMASLFGQSYQSGAVFLTLFAARLPILMLAAMVTTALVAIRRENDSFTILAVASALTIAIIPVTAIVGGPIAAAAAMLVVEALVALAGWRVLARLGAAPRLPLLHSYDVIGLLVMVAIVVIARDQPTWATSLFGAIAFVLTRICVTRLENNVILSSVEAAR